MDYIQKNDRIIISNLKSFNIDEILESGQCFRYDEIEEKLYAIVANNRVLYIKQEENIELYPCTEAEFKDIWVKYFDLDRDYCEVKAEISKEDPILQEAIAFAPGIRLLNQGPYECLISFIISQNNRISRIKQVIESLSRTFGEKIEDPYGGEYYTFPTVRALNEASIDEIMSCGTGFRAKYIKDACEKIVNGEIVLDELENFDEERAREVLVKIHGVGQKVADCVLLMALGKHNTFPTDVWIKRVMEVFYFDGKATPVRQIHVYAAKKWGAKSGFAQQYLFHYAKEKQIGKNEKNIE